MSTDIKSELTELRDWARLIERQAVAMLGMLEEHPGMESDPTVRVEWLKMKNNVAKDFARFIISGMNLQ